MEKDENVCLQKVKTIEKGIDSNFADRKYFCKEIIFLEKHCMSNELDYKAAYEREKLKTADLAGRIAELEDKNQELEFKLNRIKNNPIWKASTPARNAMHWVIRQRDRIRNQGSLRGVIAKIKYKQIEKKAMTHYGTESFPSEETRREQEAAVFEKMP